MKAKNQLIIIIAVLVSLGLGVTYYKVSELGFSLAPDEKETVWTIDAVISYIADGADVEVSLNYPDNLNNIGVLAVQSRNGKYVFEKKEVDGITRGIWQAKKLNGKQKIYLRTTVHDTHGSGLFENAKVDLKKKSRKLLELSNALQIAIADLSKNATLNSSNSTEIVKKILIAFNSPEVSSNSHTINEIDSSFSSPLELIQAVLANLNIESIPFKGLYLNDGARKKKAENFLAVKDNGVWVVVDPDAVKIIPSDAILIWQKDSESLLEVVGGHDSKVVFSTISSKILANRVAIDEGLGGKSVLVDFSIYGLPVQSQNAFKLLLLIPIGAFVVVVMRNLVGIRTSGTFLPILIALTFLQTSLLTGIALYIIIVAVGLILRSYLSRLNLLLVPRISAVLVFVIFIYLGISVTSYKLGSDVGLLVTFFPMIIISWTIERMSVLWEEDGPKEVFIQGGGSLLTSSIIYLVITNKLIGHLTYSFPELLLVVLAAILSIGSYTGYRLSELRRFEPLGRD